MEQNDQVQSLVEALPADYRRRSGSKWRNTSFQMFVLCVISAVLNGALAIAAIVRLILGLG